MLEFSKHQKTPFSKFNDKTSAIADVNLLRKSDSDHNGDILSTKRMNEFAKICFSSNSLGTISFFPSLLGSFQ